MSIEISARCYQTYPCQHKIKINGNDMGMWGAVKIIKYHLDNNLEIPAHFNYVKSRAIATINNNDSTSLD